MLPEEYILQWHLMNVEPELFLASIFLHLAVWKKIFGLLREATGKVRFGFH